MGITSSALSRAQAAVSKTKADVDELEAQLSSAKTRLRLVETGDKAVDTLTNPIADHAEFVRQRTEAAVSAAKANVDEISAQLEAAKTKHKLAVTALNAMRNVTDN